MKNKIPILINFVVIALLSVALSMTSCEGPMGPAGPQGEQGVQGEKGDKGDTGLQGPAGMNGVDGVAGVDGKDGKDGADGKDGTNGTNGVDGADGADGTAGCIECHNGTMEVTERVAQWNTSSHGIGATASYGTRNSCAACHSGNGFLAKLAGIEDGTITDGSIIVDPRDVGTKISCRACHNVHMTYTESDFSLKADDQVTSMTTGELIDDLGSGNLCANCHQPRKNAAVGGTFDIAEASTVEEAVIPGHFGPHHNPQAGMVLGFGASDVVPGTAITGGATHKNVSNSCVFCHMGDGADHTMEVNTDRCIQCHDGDAYIASWEATMDPLFAKLQAILLAKGALIDDPEDGIVAAEGQTFNTLLVRATFNYLFIHDDLSHGAHNPRYTKNILNETIAALEAAGYTASR